MDAPGGEDWFLETPTTNLFFHPSFVGGREPKPALPDLGVAMPEGYSLFRAK